jgi:hypothetical protein
VGLDHAQVGGHSVAALHLHNVADHQLAAGDLKRDFESKLRKESRSLLGGSYL